MKTNPSISVLWLVLLIVVFPFLASASWDYSKRSIPLDEILSGGPPRDGIPALTEPAFVAADRAGFMRADEQVMGVFLNGIAKAYPTRILSWHELVNDRFGKQPVLVSW
ncbi:MAG: hypothetical protein C0618_03990 [Desulfuromonas sp.]|nr:MAG: hypothetical protein C0618_03990 [Desulfuromonas sp.]